MPEVNNKWKITTKRYVAFIDIMGFKDMVARSSHKKIYKSMQVVEQARRHIEDINWIDENSKGYADVHSKLIRTTQYSDSIILYSKDDSEQSRTSIVCSIASVTEELFQKSIPHKGALAFGEMTLDYDKSIFFGQPLIDAYLLHDELLFYGIVLHGSAEEKFSEEDKTDAFVYDYTCPFKFGSAEHTTICPLVIDTNSDQWSSDRKKVQAGLTKLRLNTSGHLRKYIDNTLQYFTYVRERSEKRWVRK